MQNEHSLRDMVVSYCVMVFTCGIAAMLAVSGVALLFAPKVVALLLGLAAFGVGMLLGLTVLSKKILKQIVINLKELTENEAVRQLKEDDIVKYIPLLGVMHHEVGMFVENNQFVDGVDRLQVTMDYVTEQSGMLFVSNYPQGPVGKVASRIVYRRRDPRDE